MDFESAGLEVTTVSVGEILWCYSDPLRNSIGIFLKNQNIWFLPSILLKRTSHYGLGWHRNQGSGVSLIFQGFRLAKLPLVKPTSMLWLCTAARAQHHCSPADPSVTEGKSHLTACGKATCFLLQNMVEELEQFKDKLYQEIQELRDKYADLHEQLQQKQVL